MPISEMDVSQRDPYRGVVLLLVALALLGCVGAIVGGLWLSSTLLLDVAVTLGLCSGILAGVALAQAERAKPAQTEPEAQKEVSEAAPEVAQEPAVEASTPDAPIPAVARIRRKIVARIQVPDRFEKWYENLGAIGKLRLITAVAGVAALAYMPNLLPLTLAPMLAGIGAALCLAAAGLAMVAERYLSDIEPERFPEAGALCRGARVVAWMLVLAALSIGFAWAGQHTIVLVLRVIVMTFDAVTCYDLVFVGPSKATTPVTFPMDFGVLVLGNRRNIFASVLDAAEEQLGIDLRSTWALTVVRRSLEPLVIGLAVVGWLSTSFTVVGLQEQGLVERLGVPVGGQPLSAGLHLHWPWPVDQVIRIPVQRVNAVQVGHEGEEAEGPEDVLWAVEHAPNEYTLLLGNGRDLLTVDAGVQYRIVDARAWRYNCQNPHEALRAIAYRAVMRSTVNHTLSEALSENIVSLTSGIRSMIQQEANALGLGVDIVGFTIGGMHPPVMVASAYEGVISAQIRKVTTVVNAQAYRNRTVPSTEAVVVMAANNARAQGATDLGRAAGEAWSFRTLEAQYRSAPEEYFFRRRLETLENGLAGRRFTIVDARFQRDGGELWLTQ